MGQQFTQNADITDGYGVLGDPYAVQGRCCQGDDFRVRKDTFGTEDFDPGLHELPKPASRGSFVTEHRAGCEHLVWQPR